MLQVLILLAFSFLGLVVDYVGITGRAAVTCTSVFIVPFVVI